MLSGRAGLLLAKQGLGIAEAGGVAGRIEFKTAREEGLSVLVALLTQANLGQHLHRRGIRNVAQQVRAQEVLSRVQSPFEKRCCCGLESRVRHGRPCIFRERRLGPHGVAKLEKCFTQRPPGVCQVTIEASRAAQSLDRRSPLAQFGEGQSQFILGQGGAGIGRRQRRQDRMRALGIP